MNFEARACGVCCPTLTRATTFSSIRLTASAASTGQTGTGLRADIKAKHVRVVALDLPTSWQTLKGDARS